MVQLQLEVLLVRQRESQQAAAAVVLVLLVVAQRPVGLVRGAQRCLRGRVAILAALLCRRRRRAADAPATDEAIRRRRRIVSRAQRGAEDAGGDGEGRWWGRAREEDAPAEGESSVGRSEELKTLVATARGGGGGGGRTG